MKLLAPTLVVVALAIGLFGWLHFRDLGDETFVGDGPASVVEDEVEAPSETARRVPRPELEEPAAATPSAAPTSSPLEAPPAEGVAIRVVRAESGAAVPGIDLYYVDEEAMLIAAKEEVRSIFHYFQTHGRHYRSDAEGRLLVPRSRQRVQLLAMNESEWGEGRLHEGQDELVIEVRPQRAVNVRVVDVAGAPAIDVPVAWRLRGDDGRGYDVASARTDAPAGRCRLIHRDRRRNGGTWRHVVALQGAFAEPVEAAIDPEALPEREILLVQPAAGVIEVEVVDAEGERIENVVFWLNAHPVGPGAEEDPRAESWNRERMIHGLVRAGRARLGPVGLGLELVVTLMDHERRLHDPQSLTVTGPTAAGQSVPLRFVLPAWSDRCILSGRLLDEAQEALAATRIEVQDELRSRAWTNRDGRSCSTDADGHFEIALEAKPQSEGERRIAVFKRSSEDPKAEKAEVDISGWAAGRHELGDLILRPPPIVASGRVLGPDGGGVAGATVQARPVAEEPGQPRVFLGWDEAQGRTDAEGAFVLRGDLEDAEIMVAAAREGLRADEIRVARGSRELELRMHALARFTVKLEVAEGTAREELYVGLEPAEKPFHGGGNRLRDDGVFTAEVEGGRYRFRVAGRPQGRDPQIVHESVVLDLVAGEELDLGTLRIERIGVDLLLRVELPAGATEHSLPGRVLAFVPDATEPVAEQWRTLNGEAIRLHVPALPVEVEIQAGGYRYRRNRIDRREATIKLERGLEVRLECPALGDLGEGVTLQLKLLDAEHGRARPHLTGAESLPLQGGRVTCYVPEPGRYDCQWTALIRRGGGLYGREVRTTTVQQIEVKESSSPQEFELEPDREAILRTLAELRGNEEDDP
ncbi:MAG: hypothetical protein H6807_12515 [Planctomycetes bacterium]|nr:hypothetical protein [Planctomycetota bacterium]